MFFLYLCPLLIIGLYFLVKIHLFAAMRKGDWQRLTPEEAKNHPAYIEWDGWAFLSLFLMGWPALGALAVFIHYVFYISLGVGADITQFFFVASYCMASAGAGWSCLGKLMQKEKDFMLRYIWTMLSCFIGYFCYVLFAISVIPGFSFFWLFMTLVLFPPVFAVTTWFIAIKPVLFSPSVNVTLYRRAPPKDTSFLSLLKLILDITPLKR